MNMPKAYHNPKSFSEPTAGGVAVSSRTGDTYYVWQFGTFFECECAQFRALRKQCKHISSLKAAVKNDNKAGAMLMFFNYGKKAK
jgi:hypothetical protein